MKQLSFSYSKQYTPSAPIIEIEAVGHSNVARSERLIALVDSGADNTMFPSSILQRIGARYVDMVRMRGVYGQAQNFELFRVLITIAEQPFPIDVIAMPEGDEIILGRDILNQLRITLDGLALETMIEKN